MASKKKKKKKTAGPRSLPPLTMEEKELIRSCLRDPGRIDLNNIPQQFPGPHLAQAFIEGLPTDDPRYIDYILAVAKAFEQKNVQKSVKRALYKFKSRGIPVPDYDAGKESPVFRAEVEEAEPLASLSPLAGDGTRGVIVVLPKMPLGMDLGVGIVNDEEGIIDFFSGRFGKKRANEIKDSFAQSFEPMIDVSLDHAAAILENAYRRNEAAAGEAVRNYLRIRPELLEKTTPLEQAPILERITDASAEALTESLVEKLLDHELMETWVIDPEALRPVAEEIIKAEESRILVTENQRAERITEIKEKALITIFDDQKKARLKDRLEETAFIFYKLGYEDYARLSLSAALSLEEKDSLFYTGPFLKVYLDRSLDYYLQDREEADEIAPAGDDSSSKLILP